MAEIPRKGVPPEKTSARGPETLAEATRRVERRQRELAGNPECAVKKNHLA